MGRHFPITTSTPVTISIILVRAQIDAGSLIQVERNEKALRKIQEKIMRARNTLHWSQSNNISRFLLCPS